MKEKKLLTQILNDTHDMKKLLPVAISRAEQDCQGGFPDRNGEPLGVTTSDISDVTSKLALGQKDQIEHRRDMVGFHLREAARHIKQAKTDMTSLTGLSHEEAQRIVESQKQKATNCIHCNVVVTGTRGNPEQGIQDDRLRALRCRTCFDFWNKNKRDRPLNIERGTKKLYGTVTPSGASQRVDQ